MGSINLCFNSNKTFPNLIEFLANCGSTVSLQDLNEKFKHVCGIHNFFSNLNEFAFLQEYLKLNSNENNSNIRRAYGDFQTNELLTDRICSSTTSSELLVETLIEPTFGQGNFILSALKSFPKLSKIYATEIYEPYVWETKVKILNFFLTNHRDQIPDIYLYHRDIFEFDFSSFNTNNFRNVLILGNPPWVTNSELSVLDSKNLPKKNNVHHRRGIDAITGKGNFDIGEYIADHLFQQFSNLNGKFVMLLKNSVIKNIIYHQYKKKYPLGNFKAEKIDSKKEFNASVSASIFSCDLNQNPKYHCEILTNNFKKSKNKFGWIENKFVNDISSYQNYSHLDGQSNLMWRQGVKHDCSSVMEIESQGNLFSNKEGYVFKVEPDLVFDLLKSSDLKNNENVSRKKIIITQRNVGQNTDYLKKDFPLTYEYLNRYKQKFLNRKSAIYKGKPEYSIFGIGEYSFKKFKVAISGFYNQTFFSLVPAVENKPVMLDDTCYFIGFDLQIEAEITWAILNQEHTQGFLRSIIFAEDKRPITKDVLMRLDLNKIYLESSFPDIRTHLPELTLNIWREYGEKIRI